MTGLTAWQILAALGGSAAMLWAAYNGYRTWKANQAQSFTQAMQAYTQMLRDDNADLRKRIEELEDENDRLRRQSQRKGPLHG